MCRRPGNGAGDGSEWRQGEGRRANARVGGHGCSVLLLASRKLSTTALRLGLGLRLGLRFRLGLRLGLGLGLGLRLGLTLGLELELGLEG